MSWDRLGARQWQREQSRSLADWLRDEVRPFSPWWRERLANRDVASRDDLADLSVVVEDDIAGAGGPGNPALLILPSEQGFKRFAARAEVLAAAREVGGRGPAGRRAALFRRYKPVHVHEAGVTRLVAVAYTRTDLDRLHLAGARLCEVLGLGADDAMVNVVPAGPSLGFWGLYHTALAARMTAVHPRAGGERGARAALRGLALLPATVLAVPVTEAADVLLELGEAGARLESLRTLLVVGPPPTATLRERLATAAAALGATSVRVQAVWAPAVARALWGECRPPSADPAEARYGLHTYPDLEFVEVRDLATGRPAGEGQAGEIVHTSLGWRGTAMVRLATGAWSGGLTELAPCPSCGRTAPRLAPDVVEGAWQSRLRRPDGTSVRVDLRGAAALLSERALSSAGVTDWSLRVDGEHVVFAVAGAVDRQAVFDLARRVGPAIGVVPDVRVNAALAAARPQLGKG